jgi:hypothetical protein
MILREIPNRGRYCWIERVKPRSFDFHSLGCYLGKSNLTNLVMFSNTNKYCDVFLALYNAEIINRLSDDGIVAGDQLIEQLYPKYKGIAYYKLEEIRIELHTLDVLGLIRQGRLSTVCKGYGDDEGFYITEEALQLISNKKERLIRNIINYHVSHYIPIKELIKE